MNHQPDYETVQNRIIVQFLHNIPQSNHAMQTIGALCTENASAEILFGYSLFLQTMGIVELQIAEMPANTRIRARSQIAKYMLNSLAEHVANRESVIQDWESRGISDSDNIKHLRGVDLLYMMEKQRTSFHTNPHPTREVFVAQVVIKQGAPNDRHSELLMQYDRSAGRYQLIGGRKKETDSDILATIIREIDEELPQNDLRHSLNYELDLLIEDLRISEMSPTFGALTEYHFWIFHLTSLTDNLILGDLDRWIDIAAIHDNLPQGQTVLPGKRLLQQIDAELPNGLIGLSPSFQ